MTYQSTGNPFFVAPASAKPFTEGLKGIAETITNRREFEQKKVADQQKINVRRELAEAHAAGDFETVSRLIIEHPEEKEGVGWAMDEKAKIDDKQTVKDAWDWLLAKTPEEKAAIGDRRIGEGKQAKADMIDTAGAVVATKNGDTGHGDLMAKMALARLDPKGLARWEKEQGAGKGKKEYSPSPLKKKINERQEYIDSGMAEDDPIMQAYDREITGVDKNALNLTPQQLDLYGVLFAKTGKMISLGRGKESTRARLAIAARGAAYQLREEGFGEYVDKGISTGKTPVDAALATLGDISDTKAIQRSLNFLDKQLSSMGSFVTNLNSQVGKVNELAKDLKTSDVRLLNIPIRKLRGKLKGSATQAKYDMYLTEIESEIGKLATGSTGSVAELSASAQEKWSQIHDKNLSVKDMLSLLEETKNAANFRVESVQGQLDKTRARMRSENRDFNQGNQGGVPEATATGPNGQKIGLFNGEWRPI